MTIKKQEFYEGAALHLLARAGGIKNVQYQAPFFLLNDALTVHLKYCTRSRSPWTFSFATDEQVLLRDRASKFKTVIGLICGADGVASISYDDYQKIAESGNAAIHIACYRDHHKHYEIKGPKGKLDSKVAPSNWQRILEEKT